MKTLILTIAMLAITGCSSLTIEGAIGVNDDPSYGGDFFGIVQVCAPEYKRLKACGFHLSDPQREASEDTQINGGIVWLRIK